MTLGGVVCLKDVNRKDFCWNESVASILPICDTVSLSVASHNTDDTEDRVRQWAATEPKITVNIYDWKDPVGDEWWFNKWIQYAREHTRADMVLQMDADEVLDSHGYGEVREMMKRTDRFAVTMHRYNFYRDAQHLIPEGVCCAHKVIRIAPQDMYLASDGYDPRGEAVPQIAIDSGIKIFHYNWLRKREQYFEKEQFIQKAYFNSWDARLERAKSHNGNWMTMPGVTGWEDKPAEFKGSHPPEMHQWLIDRGYTL